MKKSLTFALFLLCNHALTAMEKPAEHVGFFARREKYAQATKVALEEQKEIDEARSYARVMELFYKQATEENRILKTKVDALTTFIQESGFQQTYTESLESLIAASNRVNHGDIAQVYKLYKAFTVKKNEDLLKMMQIRQKIDELKYCVKPQLPHERKIDTIQPTPSHAKFNADRLKAVTQQLKQTAEVRSQEEAIEITVNALELQLAAIQEHFNEAERAHHSLQAAYESTHRKSES